MKDIGIVTDQLRSHTPDSETNDSAPLAISSRQQGLLRQHGLYHGSGPSRGIVQRPWMRMNRKRCCCPTSRYENVQGSPHLTAEGEIHTQLVSGTEG